MIRSKRKRFSYISPQLLNQKAHILVDGPPYPMSELVLSHWPNATTPPHLKCDLSTEIVFKWLELKYPRVKTKNVSNDHFDEDGLVAIFVLVNPDMAANYKELLIDVASAGDFGVYKDPNAVKICLTLNAFYCLERSPWKKHLRTLDHASQTYYLYSNLLELLPDLLENTQRYSPYWQDEYQQIQLAKQKISYQAITIEEIPELDLGIVIVTAGELDSGQVWLSSVGRTMATYSFIKSSRVLVLQRPYYEFRFRYESWVEFISRPIAKRVDLSVIAERFNQIDPLAKWYFNGTAATIARLSNASPSSLSPIQVRQTIVHFLLIKDLIG